MTLFVCVAIAQYVAFFFLSRWLIAKKYKTDWDIIEPSVFDVAMCIVPILNILASVVVACSFCGGFASKFFGIEDKR